MHRMRIEAERSGFSLTELLVVIGIIALISALLFPALSASRKAARMTVCLHNLEELSRALQTYVNENGDCLPEACSTNSADSPYSPAGLTSRQIFNYNAWDPIPLPGHKDDAALGLGRYCMVPIGQLLDAYTKNPDVWHCPDQHVGGPGGFRTGNYIYQGAPQTYSNAGEWRPGYMYMSTKEYHWFQSQPPPIYSVYWMDPWSSRNIAGLHLSEIKPGNHEDSSYVAVFMDYSSIYHSDTTDDLYALVQNDLQHPARGKFQTNVVYLDGHCETVKYTWQGELLNHIHKGIKQNEWGETFEQGNVSDYVN
jgi:prepilin-type N-terminal cleavage/methylation domain-containing protein/prepilin-type processing-associated H-X9-DG protein